MPWYFYSLITSLSFAGMILCVRRLGDFGFSSKQTLLFLTSFSFLGFLGVNLLYPGAIWSSSDLWMFVLIMVIAGGCAVVGNWTDFEGIKRAKNPSYAVSTRNGTILLTIVFSSLLFGSPLGASEFGGAILIFIGIYLLVLKKDSPGESARAEGGKMPWYYFSFFALLAFTGLVLLQKQATLIPFVSTKEVNLVLFFVNACVFLLLSRKNIREYVSDTRFVKVFLPWVLVGAILSFLGNYMSIIGLDMAPNAGYHEAIKNTNVLFVALISLAVAPKTFEFSRLLGVAVMTIGIFVLVF